MLLIKTHFSLYKKASMAPLEKRLGYRSNRTCFNLDLKEDIRKQKFELSMPLWHASQPHIVLFMRSNKLLFAISLTYSLLLITLTMRFKHHKVIFL